MTITDIVKGDSIDLEITFDLDLTNYKIRAEIYDSCPNSIKLATANVTGGSNSQILITDATNGKFRILVEKNKTTCFNTKSFLEVEIESPAGIVTTPISGDCTEIIFKKQKIDWTSV